MKSLDSKLPYVFKSITSCNFKNVSESQTSTKPRIRPLRNKEILVSSCPQLVLMTLMFGARYNPSDSSISFGGHNASD